MNGEALIKKEKKKVPIVEGLFTWPSDKPALIAARCKKCGAIVFPKAAYCPNPDCEKDPGNMEVIELSRRGKLWSWTIQRYSPPPPFKMEPFKPYAIGLVDLPEGIRVLGMLATTENLRCDMEVELTVGKLYEDGENEYITWMWKPVEDVSKK
ncbi:MAG: Zn-ribbon domain-containing OB-fold protein [Candidatus Nezhaarchaeales archaeon]|nr:MAG: hypothetical protein DSO05_06110 [Candidatus Nezhaarchaeota archaeon WYZ-LMO7]TDA34985.1 MAG: hypothetical protein DSO06_03840 [Candidatus Nezhaarchaeota archaeon WYZ-LMO8]